jgi:hypothetical protein
VLDDLTGGDDLERLYVGEVDPEDAHATVLDELRLEHPASIHGA